MHHHLIVVLTAAACAEHSVAESGRDSGIVARQDASFEADAVRDSLHDAEAQAVVGA